VLVRRRTLVAAGVGVVLLLSLYAIYPPLPLVDSGEYDRTTVTLVAENGTELAEVDVRVADTREQRRIGLSRTDSLADGEGMLFVHPEPGSYGYVMRNMSFGLDIVVLDTDGTVTTIHDAPEPEGEYEETYAGYGRYVLEVPRGYTERVGLAEGDRVEIPEGVGD
jgi:uncharacterized membrane protein (UPF0127 family)